MLIIWSDIKVSIKNKNRIPCINCARSHVFNVHPISKWFCISRTGKSYGQMLTQSNFPFNYDKIFNSFYCSHPVLIRLSDGNRTQTDFEMTFWFNFRIFYDFCWKCFERKNERQKIIHYVSCDCTFSLNTTLGSFVHLHNLYPKLFTLSTMIKIILMQHISFKNPAWKNIAF